MVAIQNCAIRSNFQRVGSTGQQRLQQQFRRNTIQLLQFQRDECVIGMQRPERRVGVFGHSLFKLAQAEFSGRSAAGDVGLNQHGSIGEVGLLGVDAQFGGTI